MRNDHKPVEALLREVDTPMFKEGAEEPHISDDVIALHVADRTPLSEADVAHLACCRECREVVAVEFEEASSNVVSIKRPWWTIGSIGGALAVAAALMLFYVQTPGWGGKGSETIAPVEFADVTIRAVGADGEARELSDNNIVYTTEKLGFVYGNLKSTFSTLTILGYDGKKVHWYYPQKGQTAEKIERGPLARSMRLKYNVKLDDHRVGPLTVVAGFDVAPPKFAELLRTGRIKPSASVFVVRLQVKKKGGKSK